MRVARIIGSRLPGPGTLVELQSVNKETSPIRSGCRTLSDVVYETMKREILTCRLRPGQMIYEKSLAERFGVSNTPLREALRHLNDDGLVQVLPSIGHMVAPITVADARETARMRVILEAGAIEDAVRVITEQQLTHLERLAEKLQTMLEFTVQDEAPRHLYYEHNVEFHVAIAEVSGNRRLARAVRALMEDTSRSYFLRPEAPLRQGAPSTRHGDLVDALRRRDTGLAKRISAEAIHERVEMVAGALTAYETETRMETRFGELR